MQENLVIVESPAKAKTIEKFLGKDYVVKSSFGHIRDLSKKDLGINIGEGFKPVYEIPADKKKVVDELTKLAKDKTVWLASDEDREGEAIAWHLTEVLGLPVDKTKRIVFHEITKRAILEAIEQPRTVNMDLVNAQQARRILDRLVGFELSPVLWKKVRPSLSAGRVQSVAVRLIVEREREIIAFRSTPYFRVVAQFHDIIIKRGILVMPPYMQDMDQPRMVAGDGFILENALKFPVERALVFKILPPYDFDGAPRPGQGFCQPYFSVRAAPYLAHNFMVRNGGSGTHHPLDGQRRQVAAGHG